VRYAVRGLRGKPGFTLGVVLTLGLGIGANAAMFGIVDRLLIRTPAFLRDAERVHRVYQTATYNGTIYTNSAVGDGDAARERPVTAASASYFDLFDARPALGRFFTAVDDRGPMDAPVVVLGYAYWQSQYGGRASALGSRIRVRRTLCTVIGVAPNGFTDVGEESSPATYVPSTTYPVAALRGE
jgi:putative ABC transport system permease protein